MASGQVVADAMLPVTVADQAASPGVFHVQILSSLLPAGVDIPIDADMLPFGFGAISISDGASPIPNIDITRFVLVMASVLSVDAQGVQLVLGADTAELQAELMQERQARIAGDNALRSSIADEVANQRGDPTSIVEVDVNGLDVVTTTRGGDNETESVVLPSLIADVRQTSGGIEVDTREASGAHSTKTIQVAGTGTVPGSFTGLDDTPSDYSAGAGQIPMINQDADGLAFGMPEFEVSQGQPFNERLQRSYSIQFGDQQQLGTAGGAAVPGLDKYGFVTGLAASITMTALNNSSIAERSGFRCNTQAGRPSTAMR